MEMEAQGYVVFDSLPHPRQTPEQMRETIKLDIMWKLISYFGEWRKKGSYFGRREAFQQQTYLK